MTIFYHGTTEEAWEEIQKEGVLWGRKDTYNECGSLMSRVTWLARKQQNAGTLSCRTRERVLCYFGGGAGRIL